ncbi:MAG: Ldh family oxidoreductase [Chloroflexi bacterium]|nr:Ldh family oxidoreductase [Chloroflexota bacterium]
MEYVRVDVELLRRVAEELFVHAGLSPEHAATLVRVQLEADLRGMHSHGMRAVPVYLERIRLGIINPRPQIRVVEERDLAVVMDGDAGPGQVVACRAMEECLARARQRGVGFAVARRSNHFGAAGYYAMMALPYGLVGFATTNGNLVLAPPGGTEAALGNNPLAWAIPAGQERPIVLDVATSVVAGGKIDLLAAEGERLPEGWALDATGLPTTDPAAAQAGLGIPLGWPVAGHKGFGLAMAIEILSAALAGGPFGPHVGELYNNPNTPQGVSHFFAAFKIESFRAVKDFKADVDAMIREVKAQPLAKGFSKIMVAGEPEHITEADRRLNGVPLSATLSGSGSNALSMSGVCGANCIVNADLAFFGLNAPRAGMDYDIAGSFVGAAAFAKQ